MDVHNPIHRQRIEEDIEAHGCFHDSSIMAILFFIEGDYERELQHLRSLPKRMTNETMEGIAFTFTDAPDLFEVGYARYNLDTDIQIMEPSTSDRVSQRRPFHATGKVLYFGPRTQDIVPYLGRVLDHLQQNSISLYGYATNMRGAVICFAGKDLQAGETNTDFRKSLADIVGVN